ITRKVKKPSAAMAANVVTVDFTKAAVKPGGSTGGRQASEKRFRHARRTGNTHRGRWCPKSGERNIPSRAPSSNRYFGNTPLKIEMRQSLPSRLECWQV